MDNKNDHKLKFSWRIKPRQWQDDVQFQRVLELLKSYREVVDEIAMFVGDQDSWHGYMPLDEFGEMTAAAGQRIKTFRKEGFDNIGINVWPTFGADDKPFADYLPALPFQAMVSYTGEEAHSTACLNTDKFQEYSSRRFQLAAEENPDFIWVDDDCRLAHLGLSYPCFCDTCLQKFKGRKGDSREKLVSALNDPENKELRQAWIEFNADNLAQFCHVVREAVNNIDENIDLGLMTVGPTHTTYSGDYINRCIKSLKADRARPGHGFYNDDHPRQLIVKSIDLGHQIASYPDHIDDIQYEEESWPNIPLAKSAATIINEVSIALAAGCNGVAFNQLLMARGSLEQSKPLMEQLVKQRSLWEQFLSVSEGLKPRGLWPAYTPQMMANKYVTEGGDFFDESSHGQALSAPAGWLEMGFALSPEYETACGTILTGEVADALADNRLEEIMSEAVFLDTEAVRSLWRRGYGELTGVKVDKKIAGVRERLTSHPLNGKWSQDERMTVGDEGTVLSPLNDEVAVLSRLIRNDETDCGPCMTAFTNALGGRIVVMGYVPWTEIGLISKWKQLCSVIDWATEKKLPLISKKPAPIASFVRSDDSGEKIAAVLFNNGFDTLHEQDFEVRADIDTISLLLSSGEKQELDVQKTKTGISFTLEELPAWSSCMLVGEKG